MVLALHEGELPDALDSGLEEDDALPMGSPGRLNDTPKGDSMKFALTATLTLIGCLVGFHSANAQRAAMNTTQTTKILAIGTINPGFEQARVFAVLPEEVRATVDLYLDGKIEQWYSLQGKPGGVHPQRHRSGGRSRNARKAAFG